MMLGYRAFQWQESLTLYGKLGAAAIENKPHNGRDANLSNPADSIDFEEQTSAQVVGGLGLEWAPNRSRWFARLNYDSYDKDAAFLSLSLNAYLGTASDVDKPKSKSDSAGRSGLAYIDPDLSQVHSNEPKKEVFDSPTECQKAAENTQVYFASNSWHIDSETRRALMEVATMLAEAPELSLRLVGHADASGVEAVNQQVAWQRVRHVYNFLVRAGVDAHQLLRAHEAAMQPAADNSTPEGRAKNRRVELFFSANRECGGASG